MWRRTLLVGSAVMALTAAPASAEPLVGVVSGALVTFDSAKPDVYTSITGVTGLTGGDGEEIIGIDFRSNPIGLADAAATEAAKQLFLLTKVDTGRER